MKFIVSNKITVLEPTKAFQNWCNDSLVLDNPEYVKKMRMGLWLGNTPPKIYLYEQDDDILILPFGCLQEISKRFEGQFISSIRRSKAFDYQSHINLYPYQKNAVEAILRAKNGILVMPCGSGKTQTALEIIARLGLKALWVTHTQDLLNQSLNRAKAVLDCGQSSYGTITSGKINIGASITFATVQTLSKISLSQYRDEWGVVVVDECHKAVGAPTKTMQFYKVLSALSCRYKIGLTATPKRADGMERAMTALLGDVVCEIPKSAVADTTCPVRVETIATGYKPDLNIALCGDGTINYAGLVQDLTHDEERFRFVLNYINGALGPTLVLANRVEYLERLNEAYIASSVCLSTLGNSKAAKAERKEALRKLNDGELDCVFCTYQLAAEGLDVPNLKYVLFATPEKDPTRIQQASGRVGRKAPDKNCGTVIDFVDEFGMYKGWAKKRESVYKKLGYAII